MSRFDSILHILGFTGPILIRPSSIVLFWFYRSSSDGLARLRACCTKYHYISVLSLNKLATALISYARIIKRCLTSCCCGTSMYNDWVFTTYSWIKRFSKKKKLHVTLLVLYCILILFCITRRKHRLFSVFWGWILSQVKILSVPFFTERYFGGTPSLKGFENFKKHSEEIALSNGSEPKCYSNCYTCSFVFSTFTVHLNIILIV